MQAAGIILSQIQIIEKQLHYNEITDFDPNWSNKLISKHIKNLPLETGKVSTTNRPKIMSHAKQSTIQIIEITMYNQKSNQQQQSTHIPTVYQHQNHVLPAFLLDIIAFQRTCAPPTPLTIYIKSFLRMIMVVHTYLGYLLLSTDVFSAQVKSIVTLLRTEGPAYRTIQIFVYFFNLLLLGVAITNKTTQKNKVKVSILSCIVTNYFLLSEINLLLTFFLAYVNLQENIAAMILASTIALVENCLFQNYCLKNQLNYLSSQFYSLMFTIAVVLNLTTNCVFVSLGALKPFIYSNSIFGLLILGWFLKGGYKLHYQKGPKKIKLFLCSLWTSLGMSFFILGIKERKSLDFVQLAVACCLIAVYLETYSEDKRFQFRQVFEKQSLKDYHLSLMFMLEDSNQIDIQNAVVGLLSYHEKHLCSNPKCKVTLYTKSATNISSLVKDKHELLVDYIKCLYETEISKNKSEQNMIDYCQFIITQFGNFSTHCFYLEELIFNQASLSVFQKIKVNKLKLILQEQTEAFNKQLFGGRVEFLDILDSDKHFAFIIQKITEYCTQCALIWENALLRSINMSEWAEAIQQNFQLLPAIDQKWKSLSKYFYVQKHWKFIYLNYAYYLKNEQVRSRQFEPVETDSSLLIEFGLDKRLKKIKDALFFDTNTAVLEAELKDRRLLFKKVNKNFEKMTHYTAEEVINTPISIIQPIEGREFHDERVCSMIEKGNSLKEQAYHLLGTYFLDKYGNKVDATVLFKLYISSDSQDCIIHFVALIAAIQHNNKQSIQRKSANLTDKVKLMNLQANLQPNIFSKDEQLRACEDDIEFIKIIRATRIVIIFVFTCILVMFFLINGQMGKAQSHIVKQKYMVNAYRYPMAITINYIKQFLSITNTAGVNAKIQNFTILMKNLANDPMMITMLADQKINLPTTYAPYVTNRANQGLSYDQIDIFYVVLSCMMTLSNTQAVNRTSSEYVRLDSYLKQYNKMINGTKMQLHQEFIVLMDQCHNYQVWMLIAISCAFVVTTIYLCYRVYVYYSKRADLLRVILEFDFSQISPIIKYWRNVHYFFEVFSLAEHPQLSERRSSRRMSCIGKHSMEIEQSVSQMIQVKISLNQRPKIITVSQKESLQYRNLIMVLLAILAAIFIFNVGVPAYNLTQFAKIKDFENAGFDIFRYVSFNSELSYALSRTYYHNLYPNQTSLTPEQFTQTLVALDIMAKYQYVESSETDSAFFAKRKNYLFGNPCTYNPKVLAINNGTMKNCLTSANGSLTAGISAYMRNVQPILTQYINGQIKLTLAQVNSLSSSLAITIFYVYDLIYAWLGELEQMIVIFSTQQLTLTVLSCLISVLLYFIALQFWFISKLQQDYDLVKNIYNCYVPESILIKQKVIKQKFYQAGIIH